MACRRAGCCEWPGRTLLVAFAAPWLLGERRSWRALAMVPIILAGLGLVIWIAVQMLVLQRYFIMQPAIAGAGAVEMLLAWLWQRATAAGGSPAQLAGRPAH